MRVVDREFNVLRVNETFSALSGMPREEIIGKNCVTLPPISRLSGRKKENGLHTKYMRWDRYLKTVKEIADELSLSVKTISTNRARALKKMGMKNNAEFAYYAIKQGLVA